MSSDMLLQQLNRIDGKGYGAYKDLIGEYIFPEFILSCDYVQGDAYAPPSSFTLKLSAEKTQYPSHWYSAKCRRTALADYLNRRFYTYINSSNFGNKLKGSGWGGSKGGDISIMKCSQAVLERTSVMVHESAELEVRLTIGLPAQGRTILGNVARNILLEKVPQIVQNVLLMPSLDEDEVLQHLLCVEDQEFLRESIIKDDLIAFIADDSILPRKSGDSDLPMTQNVVPFQSPESMRYEYELPNKGTITGMGIRNGINVIVGGGFHGKSTILNSIEFGIYNKVLGDGREFVVTNPFSVKIRSEDGRYVEGVNISPFINNLPLGKDTTYFRTEDASGSTSQAANLIEAIEIGATSILIDEDTSATNMLMRDKRMQMLVEKENEPITPLVFKIKQLRDEFSLSSVLVMGGSSDYLSVADSVIQMNNFIPLDATARAKQIIDNYPDTFDNEGGNCFGQITERYPKSIRTGNKNKVVHKNLVNMGNVELNLYGLEQLSEKGQTRSVICALEYLSKNLDPSLTVRENIQAIDTRIETEGMDFITYRKQGVNSRPRFIEIAQALNRYRLFRVR
eukprot:TRINITY_DN2233_c0_g1_i1.p1 TRINITY_DN2233_c0_g1~~TRINITY_DN2233_c0_g1_i1.p1  ORF type:complete len:617 (+),score=123.43 TRINITY_DN2233_c0_g1_i1:153-1853(+)